MSGSTYPRHSQIKLARNSSTKTEWTGWQKKELPIALSFHFLRSLSMVMFSQLRYGGIYVFCDIKLLILSIGQSCFVFIGPLLSLEQKKRYFQERGSVTTITSHLISPGHYFSYTCYVRSTF